MKHLIFIVAALWVTAGVAQANHWGDKSESEIRQAERMEMMVRPDVYCKYHSERTACRMRERRMQEDSEHKQRMQELREATVDAGCSDSPYTETCQGISEDMEQETASYCSRRNTTFCRAWFKLKQPLPEPQTSEKLFEPQPVDQ